MKEKIKKILIILLVITVIGFLGYRIFKERRQEGLKQQEETQTETKKEQVIRELVSKYNALTDWNKNIHYTVQLQDLLVNSDKPILFTGSVDDIFKKDNQYYIRFITGSIWSGEFSEEEVRFVLKCDATKVLELINQRVDQNEVISLGGFGNYIVVAQIDDVKKINLQVTGYPEGEEEVALEYAPADVFIATGNCIDFVYIEKNK